MQLVDVMPALGDLSGNSIAQGSTRHNWNSNGNTLGMARIGNSTSSSSTGGVSSSYAMGGMGSDLNMGMNGGLNMGGMNGGLNMGGGGIAGMNGGSMGGMNGGGMGEWPGTAVTNQWQTHDDINSTVPLGQWQMNVMHNMGQGQWQSDVNAMASDYGYTSLYGAMG
ncbi:hypothetical protein NLJ89_g11737 [Agrocybe chaxingu]|uniref:Uncharacterized protein n=1 Tax=Agrocybe chaxingu TaxID=84603 RepID=A0A9W8JLD1_9AGAR|nr:hypothetical protein NLJ89_g11737 [Agrocybe chaxingu]